MREKLYDFWQWLCYGRTRLKYYWGRVYRERDGRITQIPDLSRVGIAPMPTDKGHVNSRCVIGGGRDD